MKKIIIALLGLSLPIMTYLSFIARPILEIHVYGIFLCYLIFWCLPIFIFKLNNKIKILSFLLFNIFLFIIGAFLIDKASNVLEKEESYLMIDKINHGSLVDIKKALSNDIVYTFTDRESFTKDTNMVIDSPYRCIYLSSTDTNKSYIYAYKYKSEKNIEKTGKSYFLYKSDPDYVISEELLVEIEGIMNKQCDHKL